MAESFRDRYLEQVTAAEDALARKQRLKAEIRAEVEREHGGRRAKLPGAGLDHIARGRASADPRVKEAQTERDRAIQAAIMYGLGALIEGEPYGPPTRP